MKTIKNYANRIMFSDIRPYEVVKVISENKMEIREMNAVETEASREARAETFHEGGFIGNCDDGDQKWDITSNPNNPITTIRRHKDGKWYCVGGNKYILSDTPKKFYDFNF